MWIINGFDLSVTKLAFFPSFIGRVDANAEFDGFSASSITPTTRLRTPSRLDTHVLETIYCGSFNNPKIFISPNTMISDIEYGIMRINHQLLDYLFFVSESKEVCDCIRVQVRNTPV